MFFNPLPKSLSRVVTKLIVIVLSALWLSSNYKVSSLSDNNDTTYIIKNPHRIIVEPVNYTTFKVYRRNITSTPWRGYDIKRIKLRVNYQLIANNLGDPHDTILCDDDNRLQNPPQLNNNDIQICKGELHGFGVLDWTRNRIREPEYLGHLCEPKHFYLNFSDPYDHVFITDLLPYQPYQFRYLLEYDQGDNNSLVLQPETGFENVCLPEGPPSHAPQVDSSSFTVHLSSDREELKKSPEWLKISAERRTELEKGNLRQVKLFWRILPAPFITSSDTSYNVSCKSSTVGTNETYSSIVKRNIGHLRILRPLKRDIAYICDIYTVNHLGSFGPSSIIINEQKDIIGHDRFELYVASAGYKGFLMSWPNMDKLLSKQNHDKHTGLSTKERGIYTYYWCLIVDTVLGCASLEGIGETRETVTAIEPHATNHILRNRQFGISYKFPNSNHSTGIIWAECVANIDTDSESIMNPMSIKGSSVVPDNQTSIYVSWVPRGCKSIYAVISKFEIVYCKMDRVNPCSFTTHKNRTKEEISNFNFESLRRSQCRTVEIPSLEDPVTDVSLLDLEPSTEYAIRLRHYVMQEPVHWTEPTFAITYPEPETLKDCWSIDIVALAVLMCTLISIGLISFCILQDARRRYKEFKARLNETNSEMPQRIQKSYIKDDNISDIGLKFWSNKYTTSTAIGSSASEFSLDYSEQDKPNCTITFQNSSSEITSDDVDDNSGESDRVAASLTAEDPQDQPIDHLQHHSGDVCHDEIESKEEKKEEHEEESETQMFMPSMSGYVPSQLLTQTTEQHSIYCENFDGESQLQDDRDWSPPENCDQQSVTSHTSFLQNIFNHPTAQENY